MSTKVNVVSNLGAHTPTRNDIAEVWASEMTTKFNVVGVLGVQILIEDDIIKFLLGNGSPHAQTSTSKKISVGYE